MLRRLALAPAARGPGRRGSRAVAGAATGRMAAGPAAGRRRLLARLWYRGCGPCPDTEGTAFQRALRRLRGDAAPRVVWTFWSSAYSGLSDFMKLCIHTWRVQNPGWQVFVLDYESIWECLREMDLPWNWRGMCVSHQADAIRLALLARYGGIWLDPMIVCLQPFDRWIYGPIASEERCEQLGAFYFAAWGSVMHSSKDYVENWALAARREHPLIQHWWRVFKEYFESRGPDVDYASLVLDPEGLPNHPLFRDTDVSHLKRFGADYRNFLVMHAAFKKLIDESPEMRRIWEEEMVLLRADDTAFWHLQEAGWDTLQGLHKWVGPSDGHWVQYVLRHCPVLKFRGCERDAVGAVPVSDYLPARTCLGDVLRAALAGPRTGGTGA